MAKVLMMPIIDIIDVVMCQKMNVGNGDVTHAFLNMS